MLIHPQSISESEVEFSTDEIENDLPDSRWYALRTRSRQEKTAASMLGMLRIPHFLPLKSELRHWSDRKQAVLVPLFSGYLFVRSNMMKDRRLQVLKTPGIVGFVGNSTGPLPIPDEQIDNIRQVLNCGVECSVHSLLQEGDHVRIVRGALCGIEGRVVRTGSTLRLLIVIETICQTLAVNISTQDIEPMIEPAC